MTFDQPLFWKAMTIIWNEPDTAKLMEIRLGAFYTEILEIIYATNTVPHMLSR